MYKNSFKKSGYGSRNRAYGPSRPYRGGNRNRRPAKAAGIDPAKFIFKAATAVQEEAYVPQYKFTDFAIDNRLKQAILKKGYMNPTPIQDKTIPLLLEGKDVIGIANTGTGKTAAFLVPLIDKILRKRSERALIIAPTRELAQQIRDELFSLTQGMGIYSAICIGGENIGRQIMQLRRGPHIVVGTPGRLKDLVQQEVLFLDACGNIVLDEADRMLDLGFIDDIRFLMGKLPDQRQTLLFSATIPSGIETLIHTFLKDAEKVSVKMRDTAASVDQDVVYIKGKDEKIEKLVELLSDRQSFSKVLVFGRTKHGVAKLAEVLEKRGIKAAAIHGDKTQMFRKRALESFKQERVQVLVATDVAARGLDIPNVSHVINFDVPSTYEDYVHRIGRTGRADKKGFALTFVE